MQGSDVLYEVTCAAQLGQLLATCYIIGHVTGLRHMLSCHVTHAIKPRDLKWNTWIHETIYFKFDPSMH